MKYPQGTDRFIAHLKGKQYSLKIRPQFLVTKGKEGTMAAIGKPKTPVSKLMDELNKCRLDGLKYLPFLCPTPCTGGIGQREIDDISDYRVLQSNTQR